jgi:hypothetical protein
MVEARWVGLAATSPGMKKIGHGRPSDFHGTCQWVKENFRGPVTASRNLLDRANADHRFDHRSTTLTFPTSSHRCLPYKPLNEFRRSSSECLSSEEQTQEKLRFYNGFAIQRRAPWFTGGESMDERRRYEVHILYASLISLQTSSNLNRRWMLVIIIPLFVCPLTSCQRGEHTINDELVFSNHTGYVFHDSRGIECGSTEELETLREFIRHKCAEKRLQDKLHAIWFVRLPFS